MSNSETHARKDSVIFGEPKAQRWRAIMVMRDGKEALLFVGASLLQVKQHYQGPFFDLYDEAERSNLHEIRLQKWVGDPDRGHWTSQVALPIPSESKV